MVVCVRYMNYEKDDEVSGAGNHLGFNGYGYDWK